MVHREYREVPYPSSRFGTIDLGRIGARKHHVAGLLEIDVTEALRPASTGGEGAERASFFAWMVNTISLCVAEDPHVHAMQGRRGRIVLFDEVDVTVLVEKKVDGQRVPLPLVIRGANEKSALEIHREIRDAQRRTVRDEGDYVLGGSDAPPAKGMRFFYMLPGRLRVFLIGLVLRNPLRAKGMMGTVVITSIGSAGRLPGWVIPRSMHNLCFALGSVIRKPWVVGDRMEIREILHMTVLFDHDVVDGAPAARFMAKLVDRLEEGRDETPLISV